MFFKTYIYIQNTDFKHRFQTKILKNYQNLDLMNCRKYVKKGSKMTSDSKIYTNTDFKQKIKNLDTKFIKQHNTILLFPFIF